ncbi:MAG: FAD-binding oxidoreductase [Oligoflexia bacterium]|nr:FAD-binding oxidoreductase [Oligoflexia bacterium]
MLSNMLPNTEIHANKVALIIKQIHEKIEQKKNNGHLAISFSKNSVAHVVPNPKDARFHKSKVDLKSLNQIIEINPLEKTCVAESGVSFVDLVEQTLKHGLIPMTVPELKTITIGGAVSGCSIESMSYKYGGFHDSCLEYEIITGDGRVLTLTPSDDIFQMIHGSYGTLGILSKLKFKLIPAKPYVKMKYESYNNFNDFFKVLYEHSNNFSDGSKNSFDFIDAIIHSKNHFVICTGTMVDVAPYLSCYNKTKIYYKSTLKRDEDFLTLSDYFFRYDTECHWLTKSIPLLENEIVRFLFGKYLLGSTNLIKNARRFRHFLKLKKRQDMVVDVFIPAYNFENFYNWYKKDFNFFPLWIVPYRMPSIYPWISKEHKARIGEENLFIDCAIYGKKNNNPDVDYVTVLENKVFDLNGVKTLISKNSYHIDRFWQIYNKDHYQQIKSKTDPYSLFENLYTKFH